MSSSLTCSRPMIISVEGNIGAGKTTIIDKLEEKMANRTDVVFLREPVDIWESITDKNTNENILQKFYGNTKRYSFSFQVMAYSTRLSLIREAVRNNPNCKVIVCERSLDADKNIFAKMLYDDGMIEDIEYQIYQHFYKEYSSEFKLDGIVYIDANAETCDKRVKKRSRDGESTIELDYLKKCETYHNNWLKHNKKEVNVFHIDTSEDVCYNNDKGIEWLDSIEGYINNYAYATTAYKKNTNIIDLLEAMLGWY